MSSDASSEAHDGHREAAPVPAVSPAARADMVAGWRSQWNVERSLRDRGYVCARCSYFKPEVGHPLQKTFPDLGMCEKLGSHRFGSASCNLGRWNGRNRPDA